MALRITYSPSVRSSGRPHAQQRPLIKREALQPCKYNFSTQAHHAAQPNHRSHVHTERPITHTLTDPPTALHFPPSPVPNPSQPWSQAPPQSAPSATTKPFNSYYKRPLPSNLVPFSSQRGKELFKQALEAGIMESYWPLAEQFHTQSEPAYCGLATLAMVLNALQIDPGRLWKGPWRWFNEDLFDCIVPLEVIRKEGITFAEFTTLAKCNGADIQSFSFEDTTEQQFRQHIKETLGKEGVFVVVSFSRRILGQTGDGHFSALAGFHPEQDMVLVMDVAKFKYPAFWCPVSLLYEAMKPVDVVTGKPRGYFLLQQSPEHCETSVCKLTADTRAWPRVSHFLTHHLPRALRQHSPKTLSAVIFTVFKHFPKELYSLISLEHNQSLESIANHIRHTKLYEVVNRALANFKDLQAELATVVLLSAPVHLFNDLTEPLREEFVALLDIHALPPELEKEIEQLRFQVASLTALCGKVDTCKQATTHHHQHDHGCSHKTAKTSAASQ